MPAILSILCLLPGTDPKIETRFEQVAPLPKDVQAGSRHPRAVILISGLRYHPLQRDAVTQPEFHAWQQPGTPLVHELGLAADVFAFCYSQNAAVEVIARAPGLTLAVRKLRFLGYREIVLIGHSAGGLLARLFVEDHPNAGVTRVVQVCAPNLGSSWGQADISVHNAQEKFIESLTRTYRRTAAEQRANRRIPPDVDFVCVVGGGPLGDGLVSPASQWPDDLQAQGIPMTHLNTTHFTVMHSRKMAPVLAELARASQPRWTAQQVEKARGQYLHPAPKLRILPTTK
ncbi:MAG: hypothetical protein FJ271_12955 [Planctomycetes bacterium]|nr:hypothetical protein [Planctomycetota bacterium]